ncbi:MAG: MarR family winged helix-turn-helix transcriptional regulator [Pseudomonadota bacterium]
MQQSSHKPSTFDLETFLPYRLHVAAEQVSQQFHDHYRRAYGINRSEWRTLFHIGSYGPISAAEISRRSRLDKTLLSRAVLKLESRGWVVRRYRKGDRRGHDLAVTPAGSDIFEALRALASSFNDKIVEALGADASERLLNSLYRLEALAERKDDD